MPSWTQRKLLLALLAIGSLALWAGVALSVSLVAGDRFDLGIEATIREYRATAVAAFRSEAGIARPTARPTLPLIAFAPLPIPAVVTGTVSPALPPSPTLQPQPTVASAATQEPSPAELALADSPVAPTETLSSAPTATAASAQAAAFDLPESAPLLLADPAFSDLTQLDVELARSAGGRPVQIRYLEAALNREIAALLASATDLPYRNVFVLLAAGRIVVEGELAVLGIPVKAEAEGSLLAAGCRPHVDLTRVKVGQLFTPKVIRDEVEKLIDEALAWYPPNYPLCIEEIVVQEGRVTVYGHRR